MCAPDYYTLIEGQWYGINIHLRSGKHLSGIMRVLQNNVTGWMIEAAGGTVYLIHKDAVEYFSYENFDKMKNLPKENTEAMNDETHLRWLRDNLS
jgi:hypothetical protein